MTTFRWCAECRDETAFEQPECLDGHDGDCADWLCMECGAGVVVGIVMFERELLGTSAA